MANFLRCEDKGKCSFFSIIVLEFSVLNPSATGLNQLGVDGMNRARRALVVVGFVVLVSATCLYGRLAVAAMGLTIVPSEFGAKETMDRLEAGIKAGGMSVFARVDHAAGATSAGLALRPTELLIFGNAKAGTPLMQADQAIGIDLPLKALVYQDASGKVWLAYNDPNWLARRHGLGETVAPNVAAMAAALKALVTKATESK